MATTHKTLLLDVGAWDLVADAAGNIAAAEQPYSRAQDVSSAIRLFAGELWYDKTKGVKYLQKILGHSPPVSIVKAELQQAALSVPGVAAATITLDATTNRNLTGQAQITDIDKIKSVVGL